MGKTAADLPADLEERVAAAHGVISALERRQVDLGADVAALEAKKAHLASEVSAVADSVRASSDALAAKVAAIAEREAAAAQERSALNVYANALKEKEDRLDKYLAVFENMKKVVG